MSVSDQPAVRRPRQRTAPLFSPALLARVEDVSAARMAAGDDAVFLLVEDVTALMAAAETEQHEDVERCHNCEQPAAGDRGLPVDDTGRYVPTGDHETQWGGVPSCRGCHALYVAAGAQCNEVLAAWKYETRALRYLLDIARGYARRADRLAAEMGSAIGAV